MKEFWNDRFAEEEYFYGIRPNVFLTSVVGIFVVGADILCIGEGEGRNAVFLANLGFNVTAVDFSEEGQKKALALAKKNNIPLNYQVSNLENFDFGVNRWDAVISIFCHLPENLRKDVHQKVQFSLKKRGILILEAYNPKQIEYGTGGPKDSQMLYSAEMMKGDFDQISWMKLESLETEIHEGKGHTGLSSVLRGVGMKNN